MPYIRYVGPVDRVHVPHHGIGSGAPDGQPGWPRMTPVEVTDETAERMAGHPEWEPCDATAENLEG
jgi:hypothetical protein